MGIGNNLNIEKAAAALVAAAVIVFGFFRLRYGLNFSDEGLALATPMRFLFGDRPFRDEVLVSVRWFEILMTLVVPNLPARGSVIALREAAFVLHSVCAGALLYSVKKFFRPLAIAGLFAVAVYSNIFSYWTPTYHTAAFDFICLGLALLVIGAGAADARRPVGCGVASGAAFSLAWASELPAAVVLVVPALAAVYGLARGGFGGKGRRGARAAALCGGAAFVVSAALFVCALSAIGAAGLFGDFREAVKVVRTIQVYGGGAVPRLLWILRDVGRALPWFAFHASCWGLAVWGLRKTREGVRRPALKFLAACAILSYAAAPVCVLLKNNFNVIFDVADYMEGLCLLCLVAVPARLMRGGAGWAAGERRACGLIFAAGAVWHCALAWLAGTGLYVGVVFSFPFLVVALAMCANRACRRGDVEARGGSGAVAALCLCAALAVGGANLYCYNEHVWFWRLDGVYENGKLKGIHDFPGFVEGTEGALDYLMPRMKKGDYLLSFYGNTMLHYLTETRPALETELPNENWPPETRAGFIKRMVERGRVPCYAVHFGSVKREPIYDFVRRNYIPVARSGGFYVWKLRNGAGVCR